MAFEKVVCRSRLQIQILAMRKRYEFIIPIGRLLFIGLALYYKQERYHIVPLGYRCGDQ